MKASDLGDDCIGLKVSYGPGKMFSGTLVTAVPVALEWGGLGGIWRPERIFITTADGRSATLSADAEVSISD